MRPEMTTAPAVTTAMSQAEGVDVVLGETLETATSGAKASLTPASFPPLSVIAPPSPSLSSPMSGWTTSEGQLPPTPLVCWDRMTSGDQAPSKPVVWAVSSLAECSTSPAAVPVEETNASSEATASSSNSSVSGACGGQTSVSVEGRSPSGLARILSESLPEEQISGNGCAVGSTTSFASPAGFEAAAEPYRWPPLDHGQHSSPLTSLEAPSVPIPRGPWGVFGGGAADRKNRPSPLRDDFV